MQHAGAGDSHLGHGALGNAGKEGKIFKHWMVAKAQLARHTHVARFGLYAGKLNTLLGIVPFNTLKTLKEIKMPPGTPKFTVSDDVQAALALAARRGEWHHFLLF